jgi:hypothetical protein
MDLKWKKEDRIEGHPLGANHIDREAAMSGDVNRSPDDIPCQDKAPKGTCGGKAADPSSFIPTSILLRKPYRIGPASRPPISHDDGFSKMPKLSPTPADYASMAKWRYILSGGAEVLRPDLVDAIAAYRHFWNGKRRKKHFDYDRYVANDISGRTTLRNAILDFQHAVQELFGDNSSLRRFLVTGPAIPCGSSTGDPYLRSHFPYPATENWQKAIGAHYIWLSGEVRVDAPTRASGEHSFEAVMEIHAEDRYNFNPGDKDIASNTKDAVNGRFVQLGWANGYDHFGRLQRHLRWKGKSLGVGLAVRPNTTWMRPPALR